MRIGICDDERTSIEQVKKCCENVCQENRIEYSICIFHSGEEVLQYCGDTDEARIDLLFLDIEMPGISGTELMEQVKKKYQIWRIVFVTSHLGCMQEAFSQKTIGFLSKSVTVGEVSKKIFGLSFRGNMKNKVLNFISIFIVMLLTGCGSKPKGTELTTQNVWTNHESIDYEQDKDIELYVNVLRNYVRKDRNDFSVSFIDLDNDDTREMVVFFGENQADGAFLFTIKNGKAVQIVAEDEDSFGQYGGFTYKDKSNVFVSENEAVTANQICDEIIYYKMKEGKAICKDITKSITQFDSDESHFYVNDAEVGEAELNNIEEKYGLLKMSTVSYSDSVHVMNGQMDEVYKAYNNK